MKAITYSRVIPNDDYANFENLINEHYDLIKFSEQKGWIWLKTYSDICTDGSEIGPGFKRFLDDLEKGKIQCDILICKSHSKISKNMLSILEIHKKLELYGVKLRFSSTDHLESRPEDVLPGLADMDAQLKENTSKM